MKLKINLFTLFLSLFAVGIGVTLSSSEASALGETIEYSNSSAADGVGGTKIIMTGEGNALEKQVTFNKVSEAVAEKWGSKVDNYKVYYLATKMFFKDDAVPYNPNCKNTPAFIATTSDTARTGILYPATNSSENSGSINSCFNEIGFGFGGLTGDNSSDPYYLSTDIKIAPDSVQAALISGYYNGLKDSLNPLKVEYYKISPPACSSQGCDDTKWIGMVGSCWASARTAAAEASRLAAQAAAVAVSQGNEVTPFNSDEALKESFSRCLAGKIGNGITWPDVYKYVKETSVADVNKKGGDAAALTREALSELSETPVAQLESSCAIAGIGWIICPVVTFLAGIADGSFGFLADNFLRTDPKLLDTTSGTYTAWSYMRTFANVAFVIVFLIIIFSQLTSIGISNYGVKKMMPRIVVAAILVNVSFFITQLAVDVSNILGYSIRDVFNNIAAAIDSTSTSSAFLASPVSNGEGLAGAAGKVLAFGIVGVAGYALLSTLIPILLAAVVALIVILFLLVARQAIIVLLIVISPLAFVAFLLPNTESLFKQWRKMLTAMLLLFPIIALVFGASTLASHILADAFNGSIDGDAENLFGQIIAAAILILPLFAVPVLLKKSLDGIPVLGQMASKLASRANGNLGGKLRESYSTSSFGMGRALQKQGAESYRKRRFAERASKGGLYSVLSKGIPATKMQREANKNVMRSASSAADKADGEDVAAAEALFRSQIKNPSNVIDEASAELTNAIAKGDDVRARAAQNVLLNSGGKGIEKLHETLRTSFGTGPGAQDKNSGVGQSLRAALNRAGLKSKNNALASWAYDTKNIEDTSAAAETYSGLSDTELASHSAKNLTAAINAKAIDADRAKRILGSQAAESMGEAERKVLQDLAGGASGGNPNGLILPEDLKIKR